MSREIREAIDIAASPERVFDCLTQPAELLRWWTSTDYPATHWELDPHPGGKWLSRWRGPDGIEFALGGEIVELRPPTTLEYTWWDERYPGLPVTRVRYEIAATAAGCRVTLHHIGFDDARADFDDYNGGWLAVFGNLRRHASGEIEFRSNRDVAVEVPDLARARAFYIDGLGFRLCSSTATHLEIDTGVIRLWIKPAARSGSFMPSLDVSNLARARSLVRQAGGTIVDGSVGESGFVFRDPFGNAVDVVLAPNQPPA